MKSCFMCQRLHYLNQCKQIRDLAYKDRLKFVVDKKNCVLRASEIGPLLVCALIILKKRRAYGEQTTLLRLPAATQSSAETVISKE